MYSIYTQEILVHSFIPQSGEGCPSERTSTLTGTRECEVFGNSVLHYGWRVGCVARAAGDEARDGCRACILEGSVLSPGAWAFRGRGGRVIGGF